MKRKLSLIIILIMLSVVMLSVMIDGSQTWMSGPESKEKNLYHRMVQIPVRRVGGYTIKLPRKMNVEVKLVQLPGVDDTMLWYLAKDTTAPPEKHSLCGGAGLSAPWKAVDEDLPLLALFAKSESGPAKVLCGGPAVFENATKIYINFNGPAAQARGAKYTYFKLVPRIGTDVKFHYVEITEVP